jgi:hypothetical protein
MGPGPARDTPAEAGGHGSTSMPCTCRTMLVFPELDPPLTTITTGVTVRT